MAVKMHTGSRIQTIMRPKSQQTFQAPSGLGSTRSEQIDDGAGSERRKWVRTKVHWPVCFDDNAGTVECTTRDLSSGGFYCFSTTAFLPGERRTCILHVPAHDPGADDRIVTLTCTVRVMRVEPTTVSGVWGIACRIEDYCFGRRP